MDRILESSQRHNELNYAQIQLCLVSKHNGHNQCERHNGICCHICKSFGRTIHRARYWRALRVFDDVRDVHEYFIVFWRMAGLATSMLAVSQGAAIETGRAIANGNHSFANTSVYNSSANKIDFAMLQDLRSQMMRTPSGMWQQINGDGSTTYSDGTAITQSDNLKVNGTQSIQETAQKQLSTALSTIESFATGFNDHINSAASTYTSQGNDITQILSASSSQASSTD